MEMNMEEKEYQIGYVIEDMKEYTDVAIYCNKMGDRCIQQKNGKYVVCETPKPSEEDIKRMKVAQLQSMEQQNLMPRYMRDTILDNPDNYNEVVVNKAKEIEELAEEIRSLAE